MNLITKSAKETQAFAKKFAKNVRGGGLVCLYGDLGAGKTTFVQGLAKGLGLKEKIVSPTFIIVRKYDNFWHIDLYRVSEVENLGLPDIFEDSRNIVVIEWPEVAEKILPKKHWNIRIECKSENEREITYEAIS